MRNWSPLTFLTLNFFLASKFIPKDTAPWNIPSEVFEGIKDFAANNGGKELLKATEERNVEKVQQITQKNLDGKLNYSFQKFHPPTL